MKLPAHVLSHFPFSQAIERDALRKIEPNSCKFAPGLYWRIMRAAACRRKKKIYYVRTGLHSAAIAAVDEVHTRVTCLYKRPVIARARTISFTKTIRTLCSCRLIEFFSVLDFDRVIILSLWIKNALFRIRQEKVSFRAKSEEPPNLGFRKNAQYMYY